MASTFRLVPAEPPPSGFERHIEEFHEFFKARGLRFGAAEDLPRFVERLGADATFRDEMASMVRTVIYRERDGVSRLELVDLVTTAVVGPQVENSSVPEVREGVRQVLGFVESVFRTRWNPGGSPSPAAGAEQADLQEESDVAAPNVAGGQVGEAAGPELVQEQPHATTDLFYRAQVVAGAAAAEAIAAERAEHIADPEPPRRAALVSEGPAEPTLQTRSREDVAPLALTTEMVGRRSRTWLWVGVPCALLLAFCAGLFVHQRLLVPLRDPNQPYEQQPTDEAVTQPVAPATAATGVDQPARERSRTARRSAPASRAFEGAAVTTRRGTSPAEALDPETNVRPRYMAPAKVGASPALMGTRLVYAPPPDYPMTAKMMHVQGRVLVEAVVGRDGEVIRAEAISGHRLLRGAAVREVFERRYKPYLLNDRPTEVATIVTVEFRLR